MNIGLKILYHHHFHQIPVSSSFSGIVVWKLGGWRTFSKYLIDEHLPFLFLSSSVSAHVTPLIFQVHILFFNLPLKRFYNSVETVGFFLQSVFKNVVINWIMKLKETLSKLKGLLSPWKYPESCQVFSLHPFQLKKKKKSLLTTFPAALLVLFSFFTHLSFTVVVALCWNEDKKENCSSFLLSGSNNLLCRRFTWSIQYVPGNVLFKLPWFAPGFMQGIRTKRKWLPNRVTLKWI